MTMMGLRQRPRDSVFSMLCCRVFLSYHPFKRIISVAKVVGKNALLFSSPLWQTGAIHQIFEAWRPQQSNRSPWGYLVSAN